LKRDGLDSRLLILFLSLIFSVINSSLLFTSVLYKLRIVDNSWLIPSWIEVAIVSLIKSKEEPSVIKCWSILLFISDVTKLINSGYLSKRRLISLILSVISSSLISSDDICFALFFVILSNKEVLISAFVESFSLNFFISKKISNSASVYILAPFVSLGISTAKSFSQRTRVVLAIPILSDASCVVMISVYSFISYLPFHLKS